MSRSVKRKSHSPMPTVAPLDLDGHCIAAVFLGGVPHFALADGTIHRLDHGHKWLAVHDGLLAATLDQDKAAADHRRRGRQGLFQRRRNERDCSPKPAANGSPASPPARRARSPMRRARPPSCASPTARLKEFAHPRSVEGLAFSPKGMRFGVARYNGATLHFPATDGKPTELEWAGAHTGITFSPDGNFLVTTMQENALHGWKLADGKHMRMTGYPAKVKSLSWSAKGKWLASSGAPAAIVWPFQAKDGPMGKAPLELGTRGNAMVTAVACHPSQDIAAIGYDDGMVMAVRFADAKEVLLRRPGKGAITSMMWDDEERRIAFGTRGRRLRRDRHFGLTRRVTRRSRTRCRWRKSSGLRRSCRPSCRTRTACSRRRKLPPSSPGCVVMIELHIAMRLVALPLAIKQQAQFVAVEPVLGEVRPSKLVLRRSSATALSRMSISPRKLNTGLPMPRVTPLSIVNLAFSSSAAQESPPEAIAGDSGKQECREARNWTHGIPPWMRCSPSAYRPPAPSTSRPGTATRRVALRPKRG